MTAGVLDMIIMLFVSSIWNIVDLERISDKGAAGALLEGMIRINLIYELQYRKIKKSVDEE